MEACSGTIWEWPLAWGFAECLILEDGSIGALV